MTYRATVMIGISLLMIMASVASQGQSVGAAQPARQQWLTSGNANTDPPNNFLGTTDDQPLVIKTNGNEVMRITSDGRVGIGTTSPDEQLVITGNFSLPASTANTGIIMAGGSRFIHNFGTANFFAGEDAGNLTMTGSGQNTGVGVNALFSNTMGFNNTAAGFDALSSNTINTMACCNTAIGSLSLRANTVGFNNTATGESALRFNTTGFSNTATGLAALQGNTTGGRNTAVGQAALLNNTSGGDNTAAGANALVINTTGSGNAAIGEGALRSNTTGSNNTGIGDTANISVGNLTNATAIGSNAVVDASDKIRLGNSDVTVVETAGDIYVETQGFGIILRDTDGAGCHRITVNTAGALSAAVSACP